MDKEDAAHIHDGILLGHRNNEVMPFAATWVGPETVVLSDTSQTEKDKYCMTSLTCGI